MKKDKDNKKLQDSELNNEEVEVIPEESELSDDDLMAASTVVLTDYETGEEFTYYVAYEFPFEDEYYYVLVSAAETDEPEALFARSVKLPDGSEGFETLADDEFDKVADEYERLCDLMDEDDEDELPDIIYNE